MAPVTELATLVLKPDIEWADALQKASSTLLKQSGCRRVRYSQKHEDANQVALFIDWEDVSAHQAFKDSEAYGPFLEGFGSIVAAPTTPYHVAFDPNPPTALDNEDGKGKSKVTEVLHVYFSADLTVVQQQANLAAVQDFIDKAKPVAKGISGETAHGFVLEELDYKGEKCRALVAVVGWDSIDAHHAFRDSEEFSKLSPLFAGLEGLKGREVWHVCNTVA
ncbi:hypothetical protein BJ170DRAFT_599896 [Xylariales sp. AK1849]|nr:hypothetical protein BJ170DRAFT_599896 [Xylariales sp. AK1849]